MTRGGQLSIITYFISQLSIITRGGQLRLWHATEFESSGDVSLHSSLTPLALVDTTDGKERTVARLREREEERVRRIREERKGIRVRSACTIDILQRDIQGRST